MNELPVRMPDEGEAELIAGTFKVISDPTRLKILFLLCHSRQCVNDIADFMQMSPPAVAHHLKLLKSHGLLSSHRAGKEVFYTLSESEYANTVHKTIDTVFGWKCSLCAPAGSRKKCKCEKCDKSAKSAK